MIDINEYSLCWKKNPNSFLPYFLLLLLFIEFFFILRNEKLSVAIPVMTTVKKEFFIELRLTIITIQQGD